MSDDYQAWLDALKAGDEVAYAIDYGKRYDVTTVLRRTKTGRIVTANHEFNSDGHYRGSGYNSPGRLKRLTPEIRDEVKRRQLVQFLGPFGWRDLPTKTLREIVQLIKDVKHDA